ncbi:SDR family NAD(P)-dependent oxidoreductase [Tsukamurella ocularis]|uniref:SDR family NAD(P)-dependent oxidoreductase n=1 Tax=Tsukamurella ocularis TaxID=1970234 RepID=UPI0021677101|nr:SDR family NAD(P)-dependent oxidoreductase [Tsukamurella ocularis]MCS3778808.1 NAD(P)-dependent dehydrogenase (short-subunit alcohol dehydrogenase family) [Tsukamurella ocularis]MCS3787572.1 NAD(P)-dependent dehydrogenase (short-subunit alcohol dehydrogenase family) [Tsukamurella ocularis]MCS3851491.1 NAD(P)-dependent dehydrogenase (short-subunit alcohol dehydrogenase family) [Tsukamurella ocularis]
MKFETFDTRGAVALVTGGARGIGLSIAERLAKKGAVVVIADLDGEVARSAAERLGRGAVGRELDAGDPEALEVLVDEVEALLGPLDIVVNNAGIMPVGPLLEEPLAVAQATMRVNFWAHYYSYRLIAPRMIARGRGHIINITSAAGAIHSPGLASYVASKHAATGFARSAREELVGTGVTLSTVMPSAVRTQLVDGIPFKWWERLGIVTPNVVARRAVGTLARRPAVVGAPAGTVPLLRIYHVVPEGLWLFGRSLFGADRTLAPYDKPARHEYDSRISRQAEIVGGEN